MTREEAKELLPIIQAFAEGRTIQLFGRDGWTDLYKDFIFDISYRYRIKPEPKYRPFKDADECWQEMLKHEPFGWVCTREHSQYRHINNLFANTISFQESEIEASGNFEWSSLDLFEGVTFVDGAPFGVKEE
jgi:hypothetical protein